MSPHWLLELVQKAWTSSVSSMGTTGLAILGGMLYPVSDLVAEFQRHGFTGMTQHWKERLRTSAIIAVMWWGCLFCYHLFYRVPPGINYEAANIKLPALPTAPHPVM